MSHTYKQLLSIVAVAAFGGLFPPSSAGQESAARAVFVALPLSFPEIDARAIVLRERDRDVVLLRSDDATAETLAMSLMVVRRARQRAPTPTQGEMIPLTGYAFTAEMGDSYRALMDRTLTDLLDRPLRQLGSFGPGRFVPFQLR